MTSQTTRVKNRIWREQTEYVLSFVSSFAPFGNSLAVFTFWYFGRDYVEQTRLYQWMIFEILATILLVFACQYELRRRTFSTRLSWQLHTSVLVVALGFGSISWLSPKLFATSEVNDWFLILFTIFALSCGPLAANGLLPDLAITALVGMWLPVILALARTEFWVISLMLCGFILLSVRIVRDSRKRLNELINLRSESDQRAAKAWRQAQSDDLTGLGNRFSLTKVFNTRDTGTYSFVFIDLDNFKTVNDVFGHSEGDEVLLEVAHRIRSAAGGAMIVARLGGDEFAVLADMASVRLTVGIQDHRVNSPLDLAHAFGEQIRKTIEKGPKVARHGVSASVGVSVIDEDTTPQIAFEQADHALYIGKRAGKAMTVVFDPEIHVATRTSRSL